AQELWDVIDHDPNNLYWEETDQNKDWRKKNAAALLAIQTSCAPEILTKFRNIRSAKRAWDTLAYMKEEQEQVSRDEEEEESSQEEEEESSHKEEEESKQEEGSCQEEEEESKQEEGRVDGRGIPVLEHPNEDIFAKQRFLTIEPNGGPQVSYNTWREKNFIALRAIQASFGPDYIPERIRILTSAKIAWDILATLKKQKGSPPNASSPEQSTPGTKKRKLQYYGPLLAAINNGDWNTVKDFLDKDRTTLTAAINQQAETPIHAAIRGKQWKIARNLIDLMSEKDLEVRALEGATPLHFAAIGIMECLIAKNKKLVQLAGDTTPTYPVTVGCIAGHRETTRYCYTCTPIQLLYPECGNDGYMLFHACIHNELFGKRKILEMKLNHAYTTAIVAILCKEISTGDYFGKRALKELKMLLFSAAKNGTKEIIIGILEAYPDLIHALDPQGRTLMTAAIVFRQEKIFSLLLGRKYAKIDFTFGTDKDGNNMLHSAGLQPPPQQLAKISGAALQMQSELQWYKEVESVMPTKYVDLPNSNGYAPRQLFTENHKQLKDEGEQWMKQTASSSTVVGALIITIMFTAAFTVPGGNVQETGLPIFRRSKTFLIFIISDAISLFSSSTSVLMFLGILTSRYAEDDFLHSLPEKLILGLSSLFLSIVAMMIAFSATLIIMLHGRLSVIIPVVLLAGVPIYLFARLQFPLLVEIFMSTYFGFFRRKKIEEAFVSRRKRF
ncbi:hypothetical protein Tsubulata_029748, partial [Turnera subulata]